MHGRGGRGGRGRGVCDGLGFRVDCYMVHYDASLSLLAGSSRQGVGTVHASSNFAASHYMSHR